MAARSIGSGTISFGLVTIPFKLYTAVSPQSVSFNMLHRKCGSRVKQQLICPVDNVVIERADTVSGYEHVRDQYVTFEPAELAALKSERAGTLTLEEFVPADTVDLLYIESTYYLGPDKGGSVAYVVLSQALEQEKRIGVGRYSKQGKDVLVLLRPYKGGLIMHEAFYANEVKPWKDVEVPANVALTPQHVDMARMLITQLDRPAFDASRYRDEWAEKVTTAVATKLEGKTLPVTPPPKPVVLDLLQALERSVAANRSNLAENMRKRDEVRADLGLPDGPTKGPKKAVPRKQPAKPAKKKHGGRE